MAVLFKSLRLVTQVFSSFRHSSPVVCETPKILTHLWVKPPLFTSPSLSEVRLSSHFLGHSQLLPSVRKHFRRKRNIHYELLIIPLSFKSLFGIKEEHETPEEIITNHIKRSILLIRKGELLLAERVLHVALKLAQEQQNQDGITYIYDVLANLAFDKEEYSKAEKLFVTVLQRLLATGVSQDDLKVVHISLKLAKVYEVSKDFEKCEQGFLFCIDTLKKLIEAGSNTEDTLLLWAMTLDWYARYLIQVGRADEAVEHLKKAYKVVVEVSGPNHEQAVVLLNDLGTASSIAGDQESAASYLERAINIAKGLEETPEMASIMVNLGVVHLRKGTYEDAKRWCSSGQKQAIKEKSDESYQEGKECLDEIRKILIS